MINAALRELVFIGLGVILGYLLKDSPEDPPPAVPQHPARVVVTCEAEVIRPPKPPVVVSPEATVVRTPKAPVVPDPKVEAARDAKAVRDYDLLAAKYTRVIDELYDLGENVVARKRDQP